MGSSSAPPSIPVPAPNTHLWSAKLLWLPSAKCWQNQKFFLFISNVPFTQKVLRVGTNCVGWLFVFSVAEKLRIADVHQ